MFLWVCFDMYVEDKAWIGVAGYSNLMSATDAAVGHTHNLAGRLPFSPYNDFPKGSGL
jgi:hypothetical protein